MPPALCPDHKKKILMSLIDDMTAAAIDRSSQGYSQFLHCRSELIEVIDTYMEEDRQRIAFALSVAEQVNKIFQKECTNNHT
jgi:hypothetical protein